VLFSIFIFHAHPICHFVSFRFVCLSFSFINNAKTDKPFKSEKQKKFLFC